MAALAVHPGLHLKLTHRNLERLHDAGPKAAGFLDPVLAAFGANRIAWGSNLPAAEQSLPELVALAREVLAESAEPERREIFAGTARRLYPNRSFGPGLELGRVEVRARPGGDPGRQGHAVHGCGGRNPDASLTSTHTPSGVGGPRDTGRDRPARSGTGCGIRRSAAEFALYTVAESHLLEPPGTVRMGPAGMAAARSGRRVRGHDRRARPGPHPVRRRSRGRR